ncbi:MAG: DUF2239 family protein [Verrucomicrobiales bacterium]|nr:DUF2239 family protein [Verrucomicrobiales bacterium]
MQNHGRTERGAFTAFAGDQRLAAGVLADVAVAVAQSIRREPELIHHVFENDTGSLEELDLRGSDREIRGRIKAATKSEPDDAGSDENESVGRESGGASKGTEAPRGPGRPRLGVVAREVTLLPRHWDWLNDQPGGASVVLRRLVEEARKSGVERDRRRRSQEGAYRFMVVMAGHREGFEEATRALFAGDERRFKAQTKAWPQSIVEYSMELARDAFVPGETRPSRPS